MGSESHLYGKINLHCHGKDRLSHGKSPSFTAQSTAFHHANSRLFNRKIMISHIISAEIIAHYRIWVS